MEAFFGNPNIARQGKKARENAARRDVNTLPDPLTYAFVSGLLGTAPDQQGFSAMHPQADAIRRAGDVGFGVGTVAQMAPLAKPVATGLAEGAKALAPTAASKLENYMARNGLLQPITVWHGSPHKFDKFDASKIGTGEGAQAYGHGLYVAESPDVAKGYAENVTRLRGGSATVESAGKTVEIPVWAADKIKSEGIDSVIAEWSGRAISEIEKAKNSLQPWVNQVNAERLLQQVDQLKQVKQSGDMRVGNLGSLYKVDLPDEAVVKMLDWDKPLGQQPREVREALTTIARGDDQVMKIFRDLGPSAPANQAYAALTQQAVRTKKYAGMRDGIPESEAMPPLSYGQDVASRQLRELGIPGIRYLDQGSRGTGAGTSNFVVFPGNEGLLTILERNGQPLTGLLGQ